jgi:beta-1,2-mannobiose phosphorylase / 1,2-beta-oligomannan phosphorylase
MARSKARRRRAARAAPALERLPQNPIISPRDDHPWESFATFNPAAVELDGRVHLLYRALGASGMSVLGYASTPNGVDVDQRADEPAYVPRASFESTPAPGASPRSAYARAYFSGGGYGGTEDPRLTRIGDTLHMTYVAFSGFEPPRVALTSISVDDFRARRWRWTAPTLISRPGIVDKNACIFPERIAGRYVIFHRVFPDILIDRRETLDFAPGEYLIGDLAIPPRPRSWDSRKVGAGPPPIRTEDGWLLIYHAVDDRDDSAYKVGAMLLDHEDPTHVLVRTGQPILAPEVWYENEGHKSGVVYPCGATVLGDELFVYYGGADKVVCAARHDLPGFLRELKMTGHRERWAA